MGEREIALHYLRVAITGRSVVSLKTFAIALAAPLIGLSPAQAATTFSWLDGAIESTPLTSVSTSGPAQITLGASGNNGLSVSGKVVSQIGINKLSVANSPGLPFADTTTTIAGLSFWADNLSVASSSSGPVHLSVGFSFNGTYVGPLSPLPNPSATFGNAYFLAAPGKFLDINQGTEDGDTIFQTSLGSAVLQGQFTQVPGGLLSYASLCEDDDAEDGCDPFSGTTSFTLDFNVNPGEDFWLAGYFFVGDLAKGETVDAFHTAKLTGITLDQGATLFSESGQIALRNDGTYGILGAVPEPATWAMMMIGFGLTGGFMRQRRRSTAALA